MRFSSLLTALLVVMAACSSSSDSTATTDVSDMQTEGELAVDTNQNPDTKQPAEVKEDAQEEQPVFAAEFEPAGYLTVGPVLFLEADNLASQKLKVTVYARGLDAVAGLATSIQYDPQFLAFESGQVLISFGDTLLAQTRSALGPVSDNEVSMGAARFCSEKSPWGDSGECGGVSIVDATPVASFMFAPLKPGITSLRLLPAHTLVRRPDREQVNPACIGGAVSIREDEQGGAL